MNTVCDYHEGKFLPQDFLDGTVDRMIEDFHRQNLMTEEHPLATRAGDKFRWVFRAGWYHTVNERTNMASISVGETHACILFKTEQPPLLEHWPHEICTSLGYLPADME